MSSSLIISLSSRSSCCVLFIFLFLGCQFLLNHFLSLGFGHFLLLAAFFFGLFFLGSLSCCRFSSLFCLRFLFSFIFSFVFGFIFGFFGSSFFSLSLWSSFFRSSLYSSIFLNNLFFSLLNCSWFRSFNFNFFSSLLIRFFNYY